MNDRTAPIALVSSPGYTPDFDSREIIAAVLDESGFVVEQDPETEVVGYERRELPDGFQHFRNFTYDSLLDPEEDAHWLENWRKDRAELISRAELALVDFTHNKDRAGETLQLCLSMRPESKPTLAVSPFRKHLSFPAHITHIAYQNRPDLARRLCQYLGPSQPIPGGQLGYAMVFEAPEATFGLLRLLLPQATLSAFRQVRFSGRCECYLQDQSIPGTSRMMVLGLAIREATGSLHRKRQWWRNLVDELHRSTRAQNADITFLQNLSDFARVRTMREKATLQGIAEFDAGIPRRLIRALDASQWFERLVRAALCEAPSLREHPRE